MNISQETCQIFVGAFGGQMIIATWIWRFFLVYYGYKLIKLCVDKYFEHRKLRYGY